MDVLDILERDHQGLRCLLDALERSRLGERRARAAALLRAAQLHVALEEVVLLAELEETGDVLVARDVDRALAGGDALEEALRPLAHPGPTGRAWLDLLASARSALEAHAADLDDHLADAARRHVPRARRLALAEELESLRTTLDPANAGVPVRT